MFGKTLTILSLIGLLLSGGAWGVSYGTNSVLMPLGIIASASPHWRRVVDESILDREFLREYLIENASSLSVNDGTLTVSYVFHVDSAPTKPGFYFERCGFSLRRIADTRVRTTKDGATTVRDRLTFVSVIPLWFTSVAFLAYPAYLRPPLHRRRKRKKLGLCLKCGYDLRASKDICPECGEEFGSTNP